MSEKRVLAPDDVRRATTRMAHEIIERNQGLDGVVLIGIQTGGVWLASALGAEIARIDSTIPIGSIDASLYRDDIGLRPVSPAAVSDIGLTTSSRSAFGNSRRKAAVPSSMPRFLM